MATRFYFVLVAFLFFYLTLAVDIDVPRCIAPATDPATGLACGRYGYDHEWTVRTHNNSDSSIKYIEVSVDGGTYAWPPPLVNVTIGERIRIKLKNELSLNADGKDEGVTLHFHGILQANGYVTMDGPQGITQSPIRKGDSYTYDFPTTQAGTFWIHSHATGQYPKGLRSPLIILDPTEPSSLDYDPSYDFYFTVSDWWKSFWNTLDSYNNTRCGVGIEVPAQNQIVNDNAPLWSNPLSSDQLAKYIPAGVKARIRFINISAFARYYIHLSTLGDNDMVVVEIDGVRLKPTATKGIELSSGQRVSVIITGVAANTASRKIVFVSDPRISIPAPNNNPECIAVYTTNPLPLTGPAETQYAWAWLDSVSTGAIRDPPRQIDMEYLPISPARNDYTIWRAGDEHGEPFYKGRPRLNFVDSVRTEKYKGKTVWVPDYAYNFKEFAFEPKDNVAAWMVPSTNVNQDYIHAILMNDTDGFGTMNLRRAGGSLVPTDRFPSPETPYNPNQASTAFNRQHTLMQAIRSVNGDNTGLKNYLKESTYTHGGAPNAPWTHTVILPRSNEIHWFVLRAKRGDHPFHMHGHEFQLLAKMEIPINETTGHPNDFDFSNYYGNVYNYVAAARLGPGKKAPPRRDTIMIEQGWDYVLAIKSDNPGTWAMHCHNDFHADTGMFMQLIEDPATLRQRLGVWDVGQQNQGSCGPCYQPWISKSGQTTVDNTLGGTIWGPVDQNLRYSLQYYGCPASCYQYYFSKISVRRRGLMAGNWEDGKQEMKV